MKLVQENILTELAHLLQEIAGIDAGLIRLDTAFAVDLDIDSLGLAEIAIATEDRFGVRIPGDHAMSMRTVRDVVDYIREAKAAT